MTTRSGDATADLLNLLLQHCPETATSTAALTSGDAPLSWHPMTLGDVPGVSELLGIVEPPVKVVSAVLKVVSGILEVLQAFLLAIPDPIKAVVMAAYELLKTIIDDFLASGAYLYIDVPGLMSNRKTLNDMGAGIPDPPEWLAGDTKARPSTAAKGFDAWAQTFEHSFDDPGDEHRPIFSDGSPVEALFIVATFPNMVDFRKFAKLWAKLLDARAFEKAIDDFTFPADDPDRERLRGKSVAPDWKSWKLRDIGPDEYPLRVLERVPEYLKTLLLNVDNIIGLLRKLVSAVQDKVKILQEFIVLIESVIDILRALSATGLHALPVVTSEGVQGLKKAFLEAENRPNTNPETGETEKASAIMGACFMAGSSGAIPANPQMLWALLGEGKSFEEAYAGTIEDFVAVGETSVKAWDDAKAIASDTWKGAEGQSGPGGKGITGLWGDFEGEIVEIGDDVEAFFESLPEMVRDDLNRMLSLMGMSLPEAEALFANDRNSFMSKLEQALATGAAMDPMVKAHVEATRRARRRGARGLAMAASEGALPMMPPEES